MAKIVIGGTAHRRRELGKCSPDGRLLEWQYSRQIWTEIKPKLESLPDLESLLTTQGKICPRTSSQQAPPKRGTVNLTCG